MDGSKSVNVMKKIISNILFCAVALFAVAACSDPEAEKLEKIVGEWHYAGTESGVAIDVYLGISSDYTFELYQKIGEGPHYLYKGKYKFDGEILTGTYSDYTPWAHDYKVSKSGKSLVLTSVAVPEYSLTYERQAIPESVKTHFLPVTKAEDEIPAPVL